ncbi:ABC transporter permease [Acidocella aminolytica]|jgi:ABC-2 type transport system permease protein|uniref:ABC transporter n=1 Tax=Acidocella aminolytica 101 = DSM 11237 TaxID=1120923 RepID=A0A0D6PFQ2_9PROT|nr:ABC transporter permease [Acidocella aminolytica]GAN80507.1 ABC transporter [Acidocella aminolytica 101 = DSM 11237]GBQ37835.1 putative ABC transporter permease [Acidocella aminolytica 101 = DSM 11237]SHF39559.1 ABC-2 type transport system permease protein [Acidocella aminolytica 101 = DSM 11237]
MNGTPQRIWGLVYRHLCMYRRSWPRLVEIAYWPTLELLIWGFTANFFSRDLHGGSPILAGVALVAGVLLWEIVLRAQIGVAFSFLEEIWSRNLGHLFVSPLRPAELVGALLSVSLIRTIIGLLPATIIAFLLYHYDVFAPGPVMVLFFVNLLVMGWWVALAIVALLFRYGAGAEALAWTIAFGITPVACVFYPLSSLPYWLQPVAQALPAAHVFEGLRALLLHGQTDWHQFAWATGLNILWTLAAVSIFGLEFRRARVRGALISIGE